VSKTIEVSVERLTEAFTSPDLRARWLPAGLTARAATKSFRADLPDGTRIAVGFTAKDDTKSVVALAHEKLPDVDSVARSKEFWNTQLAALKKLLEG
jgi:uncharacterized protein YndB with AHSA1/START domain